jgi:hypothetical protein
LTRFGAEQPSQVLDVVIVRNAGDEIVMVGPQRKIEIEFHVDTKLLVDIAPANTEMEFGLSNRSNAPRCRRWDNRSPKEHIGSLGRRADCANKK